MQRCSLRRLQLRSFIAVVVLTTTYVVALIPGLPPLIPGPSGPPTYRVTAPATVPTSGDVSQPLDGSFVSFSIESAYYDYFFGQVGRPNGFTFALMNQLAERMGGVYPMIRPGGNTMDISEYNGNSKQMITRITDPKGALLRLTYGSDYYRSFRSNFPPAYKVVVTLNLKNNSLPAAIRAATAAVKLAGDRIAYFELGNEPNLYPSTSNITDAKVYVNKWLNWTAAIDTAINANAPAGTVFPKRRWMVASNTARFVSPALDPKDLVAAGIDKNGQVGQYAVHAYTRSRCTPENEKSATHAGLLDMEFLRKFAKSRISTSIGMIKSGAAGSRRWVLGEGNTVSCGGVVGVSDSMAATLHIVGWGLSYAAFGASQVFLHGGGTMVRRTADNAGTTDPSVALTPSYACYSFAYPTSEPARGQQRAQPGYVGQLMLAEAIGAGRQTRIVLLDPPSGVNSSNWFGAAIYDPSIPGSDGPARLVLMNTRPYIRKNNQARGSLLYDFSSIEYANDGGTPAKRLTGSSVDTTDTEQISWAGQTYKFAGARGNKVVERLAGSQILLRDSEAAIVYLRGQPF